MPPKVDSVFIKTDSGNLPKIYMFIALEYFTSNSKYAATDDVNYTFSQSQSISF